MLLHRCAVTMFAALVLAGPTANAATLEPGECLPAESIPEKVASARFLVFGEVHGTEEVPRFIASYLCAATRNAHKVTIAMEIPASEQSVIDAFLASPGKPDDIERFVSSPFWQRPQQDGRTSIGMLHLFEEIRAMRATGAQLRVAAIDDTDAGDRNAAMAARIKSELAGSPDRQFVVLIGGLHAIRSKRTGPNTKFQSSVYLLADERPLSLIVGTAGGTAWVCTSPAPSSCHTTAWDINRVDPPLNSSLSLTPPSKQFDGVFYLGPTTASPPAMSAINKPVAAERK